MTSDAAEIAIPSDVLRQWQRIVDLLASIVRVPSAVVCKLIPPHYTHYSVISASAAPENPFPAGDIFSMDMGTFCETVIKSRAPLLVANALEEQAWSRAPELGVGMVSYLGLPIFWPDGRVFGTICVLDDKTNRYSDLYQQLLLHCRDVLQADLTTLVRLAGELEDQKAQLNELFVRVPEAMVLIDQDFAITRVNPAFTKIFGYAPEEALGRSLKALLAPDDLYEEAEGFMRRILQGGETFAVETVRNHKNGARVPVSAICVPIPSPDGGRAAYVIYRDMSDTKRLEVERRRYHDIQLELAQANRIAALGQLSASIAHELNQPLTGIMANSAACLHLLTGETPDIDGGREAVRRTMRDGERASQVISRLRALFSNKETAFELVDLNEAAAEVIALSQGELDNGGATVRTELAENLPSVPGDRVQLQQVVLNLLNNALDAMTTVADRPREVVIRTRRAQDGNVELSMRDAGIGFDASATNTLFEAFYSTKPAGMGVGLAVCRSIIENHRGRLWAVLNDGPGATFSFSLPVE